ncbi:MAG: hypothetical protein ACREF9_02195 [Opitutaceae bacterium]
MKQKEDEIVANVNDPERYWHASDEDDDHSVTLELRRPRRGLPTETRPIRQAQDSGLVDERMRRITMKFSG